MNKALVTMTVLGLALTIGALTIKEDDIDKQPKIDEKTLPRVKQENVRALRFSDGGMNYVVEDPIPDGGVVIIRVTRSPCAWKPTLAAVCSRPDGGNPGVRNTMGPGAWVGAGCVRRSCVIRAGDPDDDTQLPTPRPEK